MIYPYILPLVIFHYMVGLSVFSFYYHPKDRITAGSIVGIVCLVSAVCGIIGSVERGMITIDNGTHKILWCRLLEYTINSPMLMSIMCDSFGVTTDKNLRLTSLTCAYCLCGFAAVLSRRFWMKCYYVAFGCLLCLFVTYKMILVARNPPRVSRVAQVNLAMMLISYPLVVCTWGMYEIFDTIEPSYEMWIETILMVCIKSVALLYVIGDPEWRTIENQIWEFPQHCFFIARSILFNNNRH